MLNAKPSHGLSAKPALKILFCCLSFVLAGFTLEPISLQGNDAFSEKNNSANRAERTNASADRGAARHCPPLRVLSYNIHHGEGIDGTLDLERIAKVIRSVSPDFVALQEVDRVVERSGSIDQVAELARLTEMDHVFGKNIELQGGEYGNAVLSKHPILRSQNHALPRFDEGEQRGVLEVEISLGEDRPGVTFFATHFDHRRDPRERVASANQINALVQQVETPIALLAGDLSAPPESEPLELLRQHWRPSCLSEMKTIPVGEPARQIDYVLYRPGDPLVPIETTVLDEAVASDHRALAARFALHQFSTTNEQPLERIAFGSCIKQDQPAPIFETIIQSSPDLLLMLGDNIYADTTDMNVMRAKYDRLAAKPGFAALRSLCRTLATWDDHDYGLNDAGNDYPRRESSEQIFLDFWDDPVDSERRSRPGVYASSLHGPRNQQVQVILLDTRYFRSPLKTGERRTGGPYVPDADPNKTMLGDDQWKWFTRQLEVPADLRIVVSSIQCVASAAGQETWSNLPHERERLFQSIRDAQADGVIIVSGDRHWAELSVEPDAVGYPLYDLTSSSFNQKHPRGTPTANAFRAQEKTFHEENFGVIEIDWNAEQPTVTLRIVDGSGTTQIEQRIPIDELQDSANEALSEP